MNAGRDLPYFLEPATNTELPILISVPHSGTELPAEIRKALKPEFAATLPDTDWLVHELYDFAPQMGITLLHARYSRYVVDLNRDPSGEALYKDGRVLTGWVPTNSFRGEALYLDKTPDEGERRFRYERYFEPYHLEIEQQLQRLKRKFRHVLLWEAHSILRHVPEIRGESFADLMLGDQDGKTAAKELVEVAKKSLSGSYHLAMNDPFKGGFITRHWGQSRPWLHALQLEMSQDIYLEGRKLQEGKTAALRSVLQRTLESLASALRGLP